MGQKTHPEGFRLAYNKSWLSVWHADRNFKDLLEEDLKIREYIADKVGSAGIDELKISRSINEIAIDVTVARPGLVIGRGGATHKMIKHDLEQLIQGSKAKLEVHEIEKPNLSPVLAAESIIGAIERRYPYKRAVVSTVRRVMEAGARGIKVFVSGRLGGQGIARTEKTTEGSVPASTLSEPVRFSSGFARTKYGTVGVKVWITQPEDV